MLKYHFREAYEFYRKFIYNEEQQRLLLEHQLHVAGSVPSVIWELFGAILTGDKGKKGYGSDLSEHEIKSAISGSSFEYQYHFHGGKKKLEDDMCVNHIFINYSRDYKQVDVRFIEGGMLKEIFSSWMPKLLENYTGPNRKQRYRKNIPFGFVKKNGVLLMEVKDGELLSTELS